MFMNDPQSIHSAKRTNAMPRADHLFYVALLIGILLIGIFAQNVLGADSIPGLEWKPRKTVAAGFGFQDSESSSITVKTYDAESGEVLSADTYELDIKDDGPPSSHPRARVIAGGSGLDPDGLSEFTVRVYDAANGRFLWEGRLNLGVENSPDVTAYQVLAHVHPRSALVKTATQARHPGQPYFVLQAVSQETGQLLWADEFSADSSQVRTERISRSIIGMTGAMPQDIDFRIKMPDHSGLHLLWEDKVVPTTDGEEAAVQRSDEAPSTLPAWRQEPADTSQKDSL